ncbi:hypothetical protein A2767_04670 [Candidatus Roizmanbacteria bacterium RIFCSPHIGHO2_01_FULL_35_10]|uniref:Transposase IS200-like domain-containing protein n=1 Tax=Candidatus Roizmanbacteria bacterium RIFCSPLOWO2_01_FULL_35_13 TaxID=1802055 RepID=A0A1F7I706_9BACT|nr:MAG: hypothetical protein A2767_04670 [Candidatus Roizmanbacteria bacterium RIFCSPHIGHO2_01_FULL_35_10]OGK39158.1 MAG: hypothetical protein A3A74_03625 [Candidatus Roizmanbacteria bacterium RIFCSPLOWO2_01_FULL_35_13]
MSTHRPILSTGEIYHLFNRSIGKEVAFASKQFLDKILQITNYYRYPQELSFSVFNRKNPTFQQDYLNRILNKLPLIDIYVFSFMPNHYHLLVKQLQDKGISLFLSNLQNSFAKNLNLIKDRNGSLFEHNFKAKRVRNNEEFIHISRYIHLNHVTSGIIEFDELKTYEWTSLPCYLNEKVNKFVNFKPILDYFKTPEKYLKFLKNNVDYQKKLKKIKKLLLD